MNSNDDFPHDIDVEKELLSALLIRNGEVIPEVAAIVSAAASNKTDFNNYLGGMFNSDVADMKAYANRSTGFDNLDKYQFFTPGLYVIGTTPAAALLR